MAPSASQSLSCPSVPPHSQPRTDGQPVGPEHKFTEFFSFCVYYMRSMYINYAPIRMRNSTSTHNTRNVTLCLAYTEHYFITLPSTHTHTPCTRCR